jgi:hypothetical protein
MNVGETKMLCRQEKDGYIYSGSIYRATQNQFIAQIHRTSLQLQPFSKSEDAVCQTYEEAEAALGRMWVRWKEQEGF